jgi:hypothetical protein
MKRNYVAYLCVKREERSEEEKGKALLRPVGYNQRSARAGVDQGPQPEQKDKEASLIPAECDRPELASTPMARKIREAG